MRLRWLASPALIAALVFAGPAALTPRSALAQDRPDGGHDRGGARDPRLDDLEEQALRAQVELFLNEFAHWDKDKKRVVIDRQERGGGRGGPGAGELGALEPIGEMLLQRMIAPDADGRLHLKQEVRLRPFVKVAQDFVAEGGMEDIEAFQRFREGRGENPLKKGIPPRLQKAATGILKALNDQVLAGSPRPERADDDGDDDDGDRDEGGRAEPRGEREKRAEAEKKRADERAERRRTIRERIAKRLDLDPQEIEAIERYARDLAEQAERDVRRLSTELRERIEAFAESERGQELWERAERLARRAEDELRRVLSEEDVQARLKEAQRRAMEFLASPEGQEMQRRLLDFMQGENGREIRRRIEEFMESEEGKRLLERLGERFRGGRPDGERRTEERREERRREERRVEERRRDRGSETGRFYCPMHPDVVRPEAGRCPTCGMPLSKREERRKRGEGQEF